MSGIFSKNLKKASGFNLATKNATLKKRVKDLQPVLFHSAGGSKKERERGVYYVWRELAKQEDKETIRASRTRYDITVIDSLPIGRELPKTFGHYHKADITGTGYPEVYEVLEGRAWWILQKPKKNDPRAIEEVYLVEGRKGEKAIMPPGFGHVSMNPGPGVLILANWIGNFFQYDYDTYENLHGACYYALHAETKNRVEFEKNAYYYRVPELTKLRPRELPQLGIVKKRPLYTLTEHPEYLDFLSNPRAYKTTLTIKNCFRKK